MSEMPADPFADENFLPMAKSAYGMFTSFLQAGFTPEHALHLIGVIVTAMINASPRQKTDLSPRDSIDLPSPARPRKT